MWRDLFRRLVERRGRDMSSRDEREQVDPWASVGRVARPDSEFLTRIEQTALDVYASHGLPTDEGHYRRGPRARSWTFLGDQLTPEARWTLLLDRPPEKGWRYGTLADIGRAGEPPVRAAAGLLADCARLRADIEGAGSGARRDIVEAAVRLGANWRALETGLPKPGNGRLRLSAPDDSAPLLERSKPARRKPTAS